MKDISKRIKELREKNGYTQDMLAEKLYVTRQALSNWETKKTRPDIETLEKIAAVFDMELTELLYDTQKRAPVKKYIFPTAVFAALMVLSVLLYVFAVPAAQNAFKHAEGFGLFFLAAVIKLGLCGCLFPFVFSVISIWADIYIRNDRIRKTLLAIGIAMLAVYVYGAFGTSLNVFCGENSLSWFPEWLSRSTYAVYMNFSRYAPVPIIYGALLFIGINKKAAID